MNEPVALSRFDDRVDVDTDLNSIEVLSLVGRSLQLIGTAKGLFVVKTLFALAALIPGLVLPWLAKIVVDQVLLQSAFGQTDVRFPPYFVPLVDWLRDMAPMEIMFTVTALLAGLLLVFGRGGIGVYYVGSHGMDSATLSETKLNTGNSDVGGVMGSVETLVNVRLTQKVANTLRTRLFARLARLPMSTLDDHRIGDSVYRVMYDAPDVSMLCFALTLQPMFTFIGVVITLYLIQYSYGAVAPEFTWIAASMIPIAFLVTFPASGLMRRVNQRSRASGTATTNAIEESISNIQAVQSLGGMAHEKDRIEDKSRESFRRYRHVRMVQIGVMIVNNILSIGLAVFVAIYISDQIIDGTMSVGDFFVLFGLTRAIGGSALSLGTFWIRIQDHVAAVRRVFFFVDIDTEESQEVMPALAQVNRGVQFEHVDFSYPNGQRALHNIDVELNVGELIAVVGPTGAGKTSLAYLIPSFYQPTGGRVLIDGQDIASFSRESVRAQVTYVIQEHMLLSESIRSNLNLANPHASEEEMMVACRTAGAMEFIQTLPRGLDTVLGQSGDTLSVGQKQRLCIARGLIRDPKILILDEPTAALDPQTEIALVRALLQISRERLVIVIAHRLSTIRQADRIIFLEEGEIRDIGNHETLMSDPNGRYRRFVELQSGEKA